MGCGACVFAEEEIRRKSERNIFESVQNSLREFCTHAVLL